MTRAGKIVVGYLGKRPSDPRDSLSSRLAQRSNSKRRIRMIANNVGELIETLKSLDPKARVYTIEPPFDGLKLVKQDDGAFLFCRPRDPKQNLAQALLHRPKQGAF